MNMSRLSGLMVTALFVLLILAATIVILAPFAGWRMDAVLSGSMEPRIATGSMVIVGPVSSDDIQAGDIIVFSSGNADICHRVVAIEPGSPTRFITKGDANMAPDLARVTPDMVAGRVAVSIPLLGYVTHFVKTPTGIALIIMVPALILIVAGLRETIADKKEKKTPRYPK